MSGCETKELFDLIGELKGKGGVGHEGEAEEGACARCEGVVGSRAMVRSVMDCRMGGLEELTTRVTFWKVDGSFGRAFLGAGPQLTLQQSS